MHCHRNSGVKGGINLYVYAKNDPLNLVDITGRAPDAPFNSLSPMSSGLSTASQSIDTSDEEEAEAEETVAEEAEEPTLVCRGGTCTTDRFTNGSGVTVDANGNLQGVSVNSAPGASLGELTLTIPNGQVGVTTIDEIEALGGTVTPSPTPNNPFHCTLCGITAEQAEQLFTPTVPNPNR